MADDEHGGAGDRSGAQSKSFGRSTFRSSFMGASALLPKQREGEDLPLQSDDDEGEQEKENALASRQAPASFFAMGATQPTQLDTQMTIAETETELQVGRPRPSIDQMDDASSGEEEDLDDDNNLQMEEQEETEPVALAPVVYATSGRMKVLGAIPSSALASLSSSNKKKKNKSSVGAETNKRGGKVTPRAAVPASVGATQAARLDGEGLSGPKAATRPTFSNAQLADVVNNLFKVYGDASSKWPIRKWHQEVCIELNTPYNPEDRVLKASVIAVVTDCEAISQCVSQADDALVQSQIGEVWGDDDDEDEEGAPPSAATDVWDSAFVDDELEVDEEEAVRPAAPDSEQRYWGDEDDEDEDEDVFKSKKAKDKASRGADKAKLDKASRREERERRLQEKAQRKLVRKAEKKAAKLAAKKEAKRAAKIAAKPRGSGDGDGEGNNGSDADADASAGEHSDVDDDDENDAPSSPDSSDNDDDNDDYGSGSDSGKKKKVKSKSKGKDKADSPRPSAKSKSKGERVASGPSALAMELAQQAALDQGPSEAELRVLKLTTVDEDERQEQVFRMTHKAEIVLSKVQRSSAVDECHQIREIKRWIKVKMKEGNELVLDDIIYTLEGCVEDLNDPRGKFAGRYSKSVTIQSTKAFIDRSEEEDEEDEQEVLAPLSAEVSDDEDGDDKVQQGAVVSMDVQAQGGEDDLVCLSDSDDEDEGEAGEGEGEGEGAIGAEGGEATATEVAMEIITQTQTQTQAQELAEETEMRSSQAELPTQPEGEGAALDATAMAIAHLDLFSLVAAEDKLTPQPQNLQKLKQLENLRLYEQQREEEADRKQRIRMAMMAVRRNQTGSGKLQEKQRLVKQSAARAEDEYCLRVQRKEDSRITLDYLPLKREIHEKCRQLIELLRERADRVERKQRERDERQQQRRRRIAARRMQEWLNDRDADDAEFDESGLGGGGGGDKRELTQEEMERKLRELEEEEAQEAEEEEEEEEEEVDPDEEEEETLRRLRAKELEEVDDSAEKAASGDEEEGESEEDEEDEGEEGQGEEGGEPGQSEGQTDSGEVKRKGKGKGKLIRRKQESAGASSGGADGEGSMSRGDGDGDSDDDNVGKVGGSSRPAASRNKLRVQDDDEDDEVIGGPIDSTAAPPAKSDVENIELDTIKVKERRRRSGNSQWRKMVEAELRGERTAGKSMFVDTEADEDEEEAAQRGLGDFGFGTKGREAEDERDALKIRADDFKGIVDDLDDDEKDERDEDAADRFRLEQQEQEDDFNIAQRMERLRKLQEQERDRKKGIQIDDDSDDEADEEEDMGWINDNKLTDEQKISKMLEYERNQEVKRLEKMRRKNLEQAGRMERERRRQLHRQQSQSQSQSQSHSQMPLAGNVQRIRPGGFRLSRQPTLTLSLALDDDDQPPPPPTSLKRSFSMGGFSSSSTSIAPAFTPSNASASASVAVAVPILVDPSGPAQLQPQAHAQAQAQVQVQAQAQAQTQAAFSDSQNHEESQSETQINYNSRSQSQTLLDSHSQSESQDRWDESQGHSQHSQHQNQSWGVLVDGGSSQAQQSELQKTEGETEQQSESPRSNMPPPAGPGVRVGDDSQNQNAIPQLRNITNVMQNAEAEFPAPGAGAVVKRRTALPPRRIEPKPAPVPAASSSANPVHASKKSKTLYSGELNETHMAAGFGMGMAVPTGGTRRNKPAAAAEGGLFSQVLVGLKRPDSTALASAVGGLHRSNSTSHMSKRFKGMGSSSTSGAVTVAGQQFVFGASSNLGGGSTLLDEGSQMASNFPAGAGAGGGDRSNGFGGPSNSGWDSSRAGAAMASRMGAPAGALLSKAGSAGIPPPVPMARSNSLGGAGSDKTSLFAKLHARKR